MAGASYVLSLLRSIGPVDAALGIWTRVVMDPHWVDDLPAGIVAPLTDDPDHDQRRVDAWVQEATHGELSELPVDVSPDVMLLLVSALTMQADWQHPFNESGRFRKGPWVEPDVVRLVASTDDLERLRVAATDVGTLTMLRVPATGDIDVHLVLGESRVDAGSVLAGGITTLTDPRHITGRDLGQGQPAPGVEVTTVTASEPGDWLEIETCAFDLRASHDLLVHRHIFGLESATDPSKGHFAGVSATPLAVDAARQDVTATFNRTGFRATAVTAAGMGVGSARPTPSQEYSVRRITVSFDRPFGFLATHRPTSLVIFAGWIQDPARRDEFEQ